MRVVERKWNSVETVDNETGRTVWNWDVKENQLAEGVVTTDADGKYEFKEVVGLHAVLGHQQHRAGALHARLHPAEAGQERFLSWAIVAGSCGVPSLPLIPLSNFPEINIGGSGRGQVTAPLPIAFPTTGAYHVDIYRSRQQSMDALVACGNLRLVGG